MRPLLLLLFGTAFLAATDLRTLEVRVDLTDKGPAKAVATAGYTAIQSGAHTLAPGFTRLEQLVLLEAPTGTQIQLGTEPGTVVVVFAAPAPEATVRIGFTLPEPFVREDASVKTGPRVHRFQHRFVPVEARPMASLNLTVVLPPDLRVHAIREQLPKLGRRETTPRVRLERREGLDAAVLTVGTLAPGTVAGMSLELVPARRSQGWLLVGVALAGAYLVAFRDLVGRPRS